MGSLYRNHVSYGGLRSKLILPDDMGGFLSNSRGTNPSSQNATALIEEGVKLLGDVPIRLPSNGYVGGGG